MSKYKRILIYPLFTGDNAYMNGGNENIDQIKKAFVDEGFEVDIYKEAANFTEGFNSTYMEMVNKYDLLIYVANLVTKSNQTSVRIEWAQPFGAIR